MGLSWVCDAGLGGYGLSDSHPDMDAAWRAATLDTSEEDYYEQQRQEHDEFEAGCLEEGEKKWNNAKPIASGYIDWSKFNLEWIDTCRWVGGNWLEEELEDHTGCVHGNHYEVRYDEEEDELMMTVGMYEEPETMTWDYRSQPAYTSWQNVHQLIKESEDVDLQCFANYFNKQLRLEFMENLELPKLDFNIILNKKLEKEKREKLEIISIKKKGVSDVDDVLEYFAKL